MTVTRGYALLAEDSAAQMLQKFKVLGCLACALAASVMLGATISGYNTSNREVSEMASISTMSSKAMLGSPRSSILRNPALSSPLAKLAITAVSFNERMNQAGRDVSMKAEAAAEAKQDFGAAWDLVDKKAKGQLEKALGQMKYSKQWLAGVTGPMGYFDPLGLSANLSPGKLLFYREVELKHGRVAMLAALGFFVGEQYHPLFGGNIDVPSIYAFQETPLQTFWVAVVTAIGIPETFSVLTFNAPGSETGQLVKNEQYNINLGREIEEWTIKTDHLPGDLGFDPLGLKPTGDALVDIQSKEINNGRLAMIAVAGMIAQELVTGQKIFPL